MATFLDVGLLQHFSVIFPVLLVFVIVFALLEKSHLLGENKGLHGIIAFSLAIMMLFIPGVVQVINIMAPWFIIIILLLLFFLLLLLAFGTKMDSIVKEASKWQTPHWFLLIIFLIIFIGSLSQVYGGAFLPFSDDGSVNASNSDTSTDTGNFNQNVGRVIFHPKTIGMVFVMMVGALAIYMLSSVTKK